MNSSKLPSDINLETPLPIGRQWFNAGMTVLALSMAALAITPLFALVWEIISRGIGKFSLDLFTATPAAMGEQGVVSGFANALQGTIYMTALASLISIPVGVMAAVFLAEFGQFGQLRSVVRFMLTVLSGVPSIVVGVFAYALIVLNEVAGYKGFSAIAGSFALMVLMLPIIALSSEEALKLVPINQRLASSALGGNRFNTVFRVILPAALPGITTGILLAVSRAAGETAPLIFTALFSQDWFNGWFAPAASMPVLIYNYASSPFVEQNDQAWTAALVLLMMVLFVNVLSRIIIRKRFSR